jgi:sulfotransferase
MSKILEDKTFYFMGGLPRSGSTLLTAILNQHPDVYASPMSPLLGMYWKLKESIYDTEFWNAGLRNNSAETTLNSLGNLFYSDIDKPIIIDKSRAWGTPGNQPAAEALNKKPKTILVLRPILEVLSSFLRLAEKNPDNYIDKAIKETDFYVKYYRDVNDVRCDWLMRSMGEIDQSLLAIATLIKNPKSCHVIWYEDLVNEPQKCLSGIYEFLGIEDFKHSFNNIKQLDKHKDIEAFGIKDLHTIKSSIQASKTKPELVLSDYSMARHGSALDFLPR